jgi:hypothetical protein
VTSAEAARAHRLLSTPTRIGAIALDRTSVAWRQRAGSELDDTTCDRPMRYDFASRTRTLIARCPHVGLGWMTEELAMQGHRVLFSEASGSPSNIGPEKFRVGTRRGHVLDLQTFGYSNICNEGTVIGPVAADRKAVFYSTFTAGPHPGDPTCVEDGWNGEAFVLSGRLVRVTYDRLGHVVRHEIPAVGPIARVDAAGARVAVQPAELGSDYSGFLARPQPAPRIEVRDSISGVLEISVTPTRPIEDFALTPRRLDVLTHSPGGRRRLVSYTVPGGDLIRTRLLPTWATSAIDATNTVTVFAGRHHIGVVDLLAGKTRVINSDPPVGGFAVDTSRLVWYTNFRHSAAINEVTL